MRQEDDCMSSASRRCDSAASPASLSASRSRASRASSRIVNSRGVAARGGRQLGRQLVKSPEVFSLHGRLFEAGQFLEFGQFRPQHAGLRGHGRHRLSGCVKCRLERLLLEPTAVDERIDERPDSGWRCRFRPDQAPEFGVALRKGGTIRGRRMGRRGGDQPAVPRRCLGPAPLGPPRLLRDSPQWPAGDR